MVVKPSTLRWLLVGDALVILAVTIIGFLDHAEAILNPRLLTTFLPALAAWLAVAPWLGVYRAEVADRPGQVWRVCLAAVLAAPLAATLRGFWLSAAILPIFVLVLGLTNALGLLIWRLVFAFLLRRSSRQVADRVEEHG